MGFPQNPPYLFLDSVLFKMVNSWDLATLTWDLPFGDVKIAIENGHRYSGFSH
jgi:hypothetical protein